MAVGVVQQTVNQAFSVAGTLFSLSGLKQGQIKQTGKIEDQTETIKSQTETIKSQTATIDDLKKKLFEQKKKIDQQDNIIKDIPYRDAEREASLFQHMKNLIEDPDEEKHNLEDDLFKEYQEAYKDSNDPMFSEEMLRNDAKYVANEIRNQYRQTRGTGFAEAEADYLPQVNKLIEDKAEANRRAEDFEMQAALKEEEAAEANRRAEGNREEANAWRSKQFRGTNRQEEMANRSLLKSQTTKQRGARYR